MSRLGCTRLSSRDHASFASLQMKLAPSHWPASSASSASSQQVIPVTSCSTVNGLWRRLRMYCFRNGRSKENVLTSCRRLHPVDAFFRLLLRPPPRILPVCRLYAGIHFMARARRSRPSLPPSMRHRASNTRLRKLKMTSRRASMMR